MANTKKAHLSTAPLPTSDSLINLMAGLGTKSDKRAYSSFQNRPALDREELNALYRLSWMAGKIVDIVPDDMCREWRYFDGDIEPEQVKLLTNEEKRLSLATKFNYAHKWARLYGTSFILLNVADSGAPDTPLDLNRVRPGSLKHITVLDRHRVDNRDVVPIADPFSEQYGMPEYYQIRETSLRVHHTRLLRFDALLLPFDEFRRNNYFSDSIVQRLYNTLLNMDTVGDSAASLVYESNIDVVKVDGLMAHVANPAALANLNKRFALAKLQKSANNMMLLDTKETYETKVASFAGLPDLMDRYALYLAGASDVPATRLLGSAASGLNATGEGDLKNYYDNISAQQKKDYAPKLAYFDQIMARSLGISQVDDLGFAFESLFQMTPAEIAALQYQNAQRDQIYISLGVITEAMAAQDLKQDKVYTNITDEHIALLEEAAADDLDDIESPPPPPIAPGDEEDSADMDEPLDADEEDK